MKGEQLGIPWRDFSQQMIMEKRKRELCGEQIHQLKARASEYSDNQVTDTKLYMHLLKMTHIGW